jgi:hypothetical protein
LQAYGGAWKVKLKPVATQKGQAAAVKGSWEPMQLTCVGDLATVMQMKPGSRTDGTMPPRNG